MKRFLFLLLIIATAFSMASRADQLAWIPRADVEQVVESIQQDIQRREKAGEPYYLVSYCSQCDHEHVEVWEVRKVVAVAIPDTDYFEMNVFGRIVLRSVETFREGTYREPVAYKAVPPDEAAWFRRSVDLAYLYSPSNGGGFHCVGKAFHLECDVHVERIRIPAEAFPK
jgi:hypothetical protein